MLLAYKTYNHLCKLQRSTCFLEHRSDESTEDDYDTDTAECAGESCSDHVRNIRKRDSYNNSEYERDAHESNKWMQLEFADRHDHYDNSDYERNNQTNT